MTAVLLLGQLLLAVGAVSFAVGIRRAVQLPAWDRLEPLVSSA